jgi:glycerol uptake facilitator-like aquaporin
MANSKITKAEIGVTVSAIERRKVMNWWARFSISWAIVLTFLFLVWLLFFTDLKADSRDLINILVGAYVAVLAKSTDYWFKDKDDPEHKESEALNK